MSDPRNTRMPTEGSPDTGVEGVAVVSRLERKTTRKGSPMLAVELRHRDGRIRSAIWEQGLSAWNGIDVGDGVRVAGMLARHFQDPAKVELTIREVERLEPDHWVTLELNPVAPTSREDLDQRLARIANQLRPGSVLFLEAILTEFGPDFWEAPAAVRHHHAYIRGLAEHSIETAETALLLGLSPRIRSLVDPDLLALGGVLHDIGKIYEYEYRGVPIQVKPSLSSHVCRGQMILHQVYRDNEKVLRWEGVDEQFLDHLAHIVESHHGRSEWGAPTAPRTLEAAVVHHADLTSSQTWAILETLRTGSAGLDGWVTSPEWGREPVHHARLGVPAGSRSAAELMDVVRETGHEEPDDVWDDWIYRYDFLNLMGLGLM